MEKWSIFIIPFPLAHEAQLAPFAFAPRSRVVWKGEASWSARRHPGTMVERQGWGITRHHEASPSNTFCSYQEVHQDNLVGLEHEVYFSIYWDMLSSQLTFTFFRGVGFNHQPVIVPLRWWFLRLQYLIQMGKVKINVMARPNKFDVSQVCTISIYTWYTVYTYFV